MKKISNKFKVLMALCSGPKTQAELVRETKVKNVYQMMSSLIKSGEVIKRPDGKVLLRDSLNPLYTKEHKIAHYKYLAGVTKVKPKEPEDYIRNPRLSDAKRLPVAVDETKKVSAEQLETALPKPESEIITTLRGEVENIQDGIRSLMMARSYLLRRIEEEKRDA